MARLPLHPNAISLEQVRNEFGGGYSVYLSNYYRGGPYVPSITYGYPYHVRTLIPAGGQISLGNFHGSFKAYSIAFYSSTYWVVPAGVDRVSVVLAAGGGGGGAGNGLEGGGGGGAGGVLYLRNIGVTPGSTIYIGIGGGGSGSYNGANSQFGGYVAYGGGTGGVGYSVITAVVGYNFTLGPTHPVYYRSVYQVMHEDYYGGYNYPFGDGFSYETFNRYPDGWAVRPDYGSIEYGGGGWAKFQATPVYDTVWLSSKYGASGGSGGGGMGYYGGAYGGSGVSGQGNSGGYGYEEGSSGGGGGRGGPGGSPYGGVGIDISWLDRFIRLGGGGQGGGWGYNGDTPWGGGSGAPQYASGLSGATYTGGGGGGGGADGGPGGHGGSGVCYVLVGGED